MKLNNQEVLVCNCEGTMSIDEKALSRACAATPNIDSDGELSVAGQLCRGEIEEFMRLAKDSEKLLIACSGGLDSVVLTYLIKELNCEMALAHCNFSLRGKESDSDEMFVIGLAKNLEIPVFAETFDTKKFSEEHKISTQMAARELRYAWFAEILKDFKYDYL
mgnify:CR=1 FL=1